MPTCRAVKSHATGRGLATLLFGLLLGVIMLSPAPSHAASEVVDEVHYTFMGPTSVAFDWRGGGNWIRYGTTINTAGVVTASGDYGSPIVNARTRNWPVAFWKS